MPSRREIKDAGLSGARADKLAAIERKANKDRDRAPARPEAPRGLEARVRERAGASARSRRNFRSTAP